MAHRMRSTTGHEEYFQNVSPRGCQPRKLRPLPSAQSGGGRDRYRHFSLQLSVLEIAFRLPPTDSNRHYTTQRGAGRCTGAGCRTAGGDLNGSERWTASHFILVPLAQTVRETMITMQAVGLPKNVQSTHKI